VQGPDSNWASGPSHQGGNQSARGGATGGATGGSDMGAGGAWKSGAGGTIWPGHHQGAQPRCIHQLTMHWPVCAPCTTLPSSPSTHVRTPSCTTSGTTPALWLPPGGWGRCQLLSGPCTTVSNQLSTRLWPPYSSTTQGPWSQ